MRQFFEDLFGITAKKLLTFNGENERHLAVRNNNVAKLKTLLEKGLIKADDTLDKHNNLTILSYAVAMNRKEIVKLLLIWGADPNQADLWGTTPVMRAAANEDPSILEMFLDRKLANLNAKDDLGRTACDYADLYDYDQNLKLMECPVKSEMA